MKIRKIITLGALLLSMAGVAVAGKVTLQPMESDPRFPPVDMYHAGCAQNAQVFFEGKEKNISKIHLELVYVPEELEISRVLGADNLIANYRIESDRIVFDIDNPVVQDSTPLFHIAFKSKGNTQTSDILVATGSYFVTNGKIVYLSARFPLQFASVPECEPDVIPPSVTLIFPKDPAAKISLDQYFLFEIKDSGKGIDKQNVKIFLNDQLYTADSANLQWKGNYLTFYPQDRLDVNQKVSLQVSVGDLQSYGGANVTEKMFKFQTTTGMALLDNIDPMTFRTLAREGTKITATAEECLLLQNLHATSDTSFQSGLVAIMGKLACDTNNLNSGDLFDESHAAAEEKTSNLTYISVFAALGRILFIIALVLKLHYLASYKKQKKLARRYKNA